MKNLNLKLWLVILPLSIIACTDEYITESVENADTENEHKEFSAKHNQSEARNSSNPFDIAGSVHNDILEILEQTNYSSYSVGEIAIVIDSIAALHPDLDVLAGGTSLSSRLPEIEWIVNDNEAIENVLAASALGTAARASFTSFVNSLLLSGDNSYEDIYNMIMSYEAVISSNGGLTYEEKRILLTTTSIARYSIYRKKREDKDWDTSVGNFAATVSGAQEGTALGLKMAAAVGACQNNNITQ